MTLFSGNFKQKGIAVNLLAIVGARKEKSTDTLVDKAIEGARSVNADCKVKKVNLFDYKLEFCKNCMACRFSKSTDSWVKCAIKDDDYADLAQELEKADRLIVGAPVHMGFAPGIMTTFMERICWTFGKPGKNYLTIKGCPLPRSDKKRKGVIIISSGVVGPIYRKFCDQATPLIKQIFTDSLNCDLVGDMYAGNNEARGVEPYLAKAFKIGSKLG
jgi:putative NADPH-quinone reductase